MGILKLRFLLKYGKMNIPSSLLCKLSRRIPLLVSHGKHSPSNSGRGSCDQRPFSVERYDVMI